MTDGRALIQPSVNHQRTVRFNPYYPNFEFFHKNLRFAVFLTVENDFSSKNSKKKKILASKDQISKCQFKLTLGIAGWVFLFPLFL